MRSTNALATLFAVLAIGTACWLLRPLPDLEADLAPAPPPESTNQPAVRAANPLASPPSPPPTTAEAAHLEIDPGAGVTPDPAARKPGPRMGGLPLDGEELLALQIPEVQTLAAILHDAGATAPALKAHLRVAYGHVQRLRQFRQFADRAEARVHLLAQANEPGSNTADSGDPSRSALLAAVERTRQGEVERVAEYEDYVRRSIAQDFAITNEGVLQGILALGRLPPQLELGLVSGSESESEPEPHAEAEAEAPPELHFHAEPPPAADNPDSPDPSGLRPP